MNDKFDANESPNDELLTVLAATRGSTNAYVAPILLKTPPPNVIEIKPEQERAVKVKPIKNNVSGKSAPLKPAPSSWSTTFLSWFGWVAILSSVASFLYLLNRDAASGRLPQTTSQTLVATNEKVADKFLETPLVSDVPPKREAPETNANKELALIDVNAIEPSAPSSPQIYRKKIADIKIGERTVGTNPQGANQAESDATIFERVKHCGYKLCYLKENGTQCSINLQCPEDWLDYEIVQLRRKIDDKVLDELDFQLMAMEPYHFDDSGAYDVEVWLALPETGVIGWAKLLEIDAEVKNQGGAGNVVTGTFAHISDEVIDLQIEAQAKPIGCTIHHPFWSFDRQDFVEAGQLQKGERVQLYNGETKRVVQKLPRPGPQNVFNLEVYSEHVYQVTLDGVLVHNSCGTTTYQIHHFATNKI